MSALRKHHTLKKYLRFPNAMNKTSPIAQYLLFNLVKSKILKISQLSNIKKKSY